MPDLAKVGAKWTLAEDQQQLLRDLDAQQLEPAQTWRELCLQLLRPEQPFELHQQLFAAVYRDWGSSSGSSSSSSGSRPPPPPVWLPDTQQASATNAARFMATFQGDLAWEAGRTGDPAADWPLLQAVSCANPDVFWGALLGAGGLRLRFAAPPSRVVVMDDVAAPDQARWLPGARLNIAAAALHSPLSPGPSHPALLLAGEGAPTTLTRVSWGELRDACMDAAACIAAAFAPGDAIAVAMPMNASSVVAYLSIILAGCVAVSIADSFSAREVDARLRLAGAKAIITQDVIPRGGKLLPLYARMLDAPHLPPAIVVQAAAAAAAAGRAAAAAPGAAAAAAAAAASSSSGGGGVALRVGDVWWREFIASGGRSSGSTATVTPSSSSSSAPAAAAAWRGRPLPHIVDASAPCNILFSSGTTGEPKAIPWSHATPLRCAVDGWAHQDITPGDVVAWPTNLGWMMGPWLLYAALINGATVALYGGSPLGRDFGEFVSAARVNVLGLVPSIVKAWRASGCMSHLDWSHLRCFSSTGEASSPEDYHWLASRVVGYRPVIEYCGGTEIGGGFLSGSLLQPQAPSTFSTPTLGARLVLLTEGGQLLLPNRACTGAIGELALVPPMLGASQRLLLRDHTATYYGGMPASDASGGPLRRHGDEIEVLPGGYYRALGRCDDTMNLGGIKVSSVELERIILGAVPGISEVAAVGVPAPGGGPEQLHLFVVLAPSSSGSGQQQQHDAAGGSGSGNAAAARQQQQQAQLLAACQAAVRAQLNPLFKVAALLVVPSLPRTASNKVMRRLLRDQVTAASSHTPRL